MVDLISPIVDVISRLWPCCAKHMRYLCKLQENKKLLTIALDELKEARDEVQRRVVEEEAESNEPKKCIDPVRRWLQRVRIIEDEVEEILQKADEQQLNRGRCFGSCCPPNKCWSNYKLGKSVVKKMAYVYEWKGKGQFQEVTYRLPPPLVQDMNLESTVGMDSMFEDVWKIITRTEDKVVRIMGIYGLGGVGKTTLLKRINNEFNKISGEHDHIVIFVVVSKPINYKAIQKTVGRRLWFSDLLEEDGDESSRAVKIFNKLRNKNFVILLDDIWERVDLERIGIPSPFTRCNSSKVIFTTRNKEVFGLMDATYKFQVKRLPNDEAWSLFQNKVGEEALNSFPRARELAELVAKECGGLPLVLITIGRAMATTTSVEEWNNAITTLRNSASEFPGMSDEVLPRLKLSYDYLCDETIKSCFLYCALFPEDHSINIDQLIDYWIGEGFLNRFDNLDNARNHGRHVIETLKRACMLESGEFEQFQVKMHDIIRDLALWIVNDCKNSSTTTDKFLVTSNVCERWRNAERIFWTNDDEDGINNELEEPLVLPNLRTLIVRVEASFSLPQSFFQFMPSLVVLDFLDFQLRELPTSICQLSELQYLGLKQTKIKELPIELRKLVKLKFLDLTGASELRKIPPGVLSNLSKLQVLKIANSGFKVWELKEEDFGLSFCELERLKHLQEIQITINTSLALDKLLCNQKLRILCTALVLDNCVNIKSVSLPPSSISKGLGNLTSLKHLIINNSDEFEEFNINDGRETNTTIGGTGLLTNNKLEYLYLHGLRRLNNIIWGEKYHHYLHVPPFQNLFVIDIDSCNTLKDLTWLVYVKNLKKLIVRFCEGLETIIELGDDGLEGAQGGGDQILNLGGRVFERLEDLIIRSLPKLKSICRHALAFPSINNINVRGCPKLKKLPLDSGSNFKNTLTEIKGDPEWWNELEWKDETIKSKFLPYFKVQSSLQAGSVKKLKMLPLNEGIKWAKQLGLGE